MNPLLLFAYVLIIISAGVKVVALRMLANKQIDPSIAQKNYMKFNIISYCLLFPGVFIWAYLTFF
ncbi:MAG: hypothetical protein IKM15_01700 [Peptococcaceae bacterium]|nr:hypothetical protein [Peptococcaceae bacterium]